MTRDDLIHRAGEITSRRSAAARDLHTMVCGHSMHADISYEEAFREIARDITKAIQTIRAEIKGMDE